MSKHRSIKQIHRAQSAPMGDLVTYRALPTRTLDYLDPFLFLNHHGPQVYAKNNRGLPFGPHPHRGMETVTIIVEGDICHSDSEGHTSTVSAGGVQWMTAGRGVIHSEVSSEEFKKNGGPLEILQLWINLPAKHKMAEPFYKGLQKNEIPTVEYDGGKVKVHLLAGDLDGQSAAFRTFTDLRLQTIALKTGGRLLLEIPATHTVFFYLIRGTLLINEKTSHMLDLVEFETAEGDITVSAVTDSLLLFGHAAPLNEPVVSHGPFVMNTEAEIRQAYEDYHQGRFGTWQQ